MADRFAIYVRVSETRGREGESFMSPEEQEATARQWIERAGGEAFYDPEECLELDVSGAIAASERKLGRLIERCEAGEFQGIVVRAEDRFARDPIEGGVALARITECGARLVATYSGFDSENLTPEKQMVFDIMMSIGKAQRSRNRLARMNGSRRACEQGYYLATSAPLGYRLIDRRIRDDGSEGVGRLEPDPVTAPLVREAFAMRGRRASAGQIRDYLRAHGVSISKSGVRVLLANRAYLGEATAPTERKGVLETFYDHHDALVTRDAFEEAQAAVGAYIPRDGSAAGVTALSGLVICSGCGRRMQIQKGKGASGVSYACRTDDCEERASIRADRLDPWVHSELLREAREGNPWIGAVLSGDDRRRHALNGVRQAQDELDTYRRDVAISLVGVEAWKRDVEARTLQLEAARAVLRATPTPIAEGVLNLDPSEPRSAAPFVGRIVVVPVGRGRRLPPGERATIYWAGEWEALQYAEQEASWQ